MTGAGFWQLAVSLAGGLLSGAASVVWLELWYKPRRGRRHAAVLLATEITQNDATIRDTLAQEEQQAEDPGATASMILQRVAAPGHLRGIEWLPPATLAAVLKLYARYDTLGSYHRLQQEDLAAYLARPQTTAANWQVTHNVLCENMRRTIAQAEELLPDLRRIGQLAAADKRQPDWQRWLKRVAVSLPAFVVAWCLWAGFAPLTGTLPDLGHRPTRIPIHGNPAFAYLTNSIRMGPADEVHAWLQLDTTNWYIGVRCDEGTFHAESNGQRTFREAWAPVPPSGFSASYTRALCSTSPRTFEQRLLTRVRWILPPLTSPKAPDLADNPFGGPDPQQVLREARLAQLSARVDRRHAIARLRSWLERGRDTVTAAGVDSAAFASRVLTTCPLRQVGSATTTDTLPKQSWLAACAESWLSELAPRRDTAGAHESETDR